MRETYGTFVNLVQNAQPERDAEGVESEYETAPAVSPEVGHVHVETREEHDVEQSGCSGEDDAAVAQHEVESVRSDHRTGDDESQQVGYFEFVEDQRGCEDDDQNQQKLQNRVFERQREIYVCEEEHGFADPL